MYADDSDIYDDDDDDDDVDDDDDGYDFGNTNGENRGE